MIDIENISKYYGAKAILEGVDLFIGEGDRIGVVGLNGAGKTTLFKIILGEEMPDEGRINRPKHLSIGYLSQDVYIQAGDNRNALQECIIGVKGIGTLLQQKEKIQTQLLGAQDAGESNQLAVLLDEVEHELVHAGYHSMEARAKTILTGLGFDETDMNQPLSTLSGGFLMRLQLAKLLLSEPDLMLLDEPTNHLDLESLVFLENYIKNYKGAFCVATHDRVFLNRAVSRIWELERGKVTVYSGGFDDYRKLKAEAVRHRMKQYEEQQAQIKAAEEFIARNRVRKDKARLIQSRKRFLEKLERIEKPVSEKSVRLQFPQPPKGPDKVVILQGIEKSFGTKKVLQKVDLTISRGEKVVLVGRNGAGKTTLLRVIAGVMEPDAGRRILGREVEVGYYAQDQLDVLDPQSTPYREVLKLAGPDIAPRVRGMLGAFRLSGDDIEKKVMVLSGGEKARVALCRLLIRRPVLLVMDEPTNHLDIPSMEVLEQALKDFTGTVIMVSHDRTFIDAVATRVVEVDFGRLRSYPGNYSYYLEKKKVEQGRAGTKDHTNRGRSKKNAANQVDRKQKRKLEAELRNQRYRVLAPLRQRVNALEARIEKVETEIEELNLQLADPQLYSDPEKALGVSSKHKELKKLLDDLMVEWEKAHRRLQQALEEFESQPLT